MLQQHGMFKFNTYTHVDNTSGYLRSHPCFWVTSPLGCPKKWGVFIPSCERMEYSFEFFLLKLPSCLKLPKQVSNSSMYSFRVVDWEKMLLLKGAMSITGVRSSPTNLATL